MLRSSNQMSFVAVSSVGKWPRVLMILRNCALMFSMAFVVYIYAPFRRNIHRLAVFSGEAVAPSQPLDPGIHDDHVAVAISFSAAHDNRVTITRKILSHRPLTESECKSISIDWGSLETINGLFPGTEDTRPTMCHK